MDIVGCRFCSVLHCWIFWGCATIQSWPSFISPVPCLFSCLSFTIKFPSFLSSFYYLPTPRMIYNSQFTYKQDVFGIWKVAKVVTQRICNVQEVRINVRLLALFWNQHQLAQYVGHYDFASQNILVNEQLLQSVCFVLSNSYTQQLFVLMFSRFPFSLSNISLIPHFTFIRAPT